MKYFPGALWHCAKLQMGVEAARPGSRERAAAKRDWICKWLMYNHNFEVVKLSPSRRAARGHARSGTLFQQASTALSTRIVDKGEILTLPATCVDLLLTPATTARKSGSCGRGARA
jgi:hypothetical protein